MSVFVAPSCFASSPTFSEAPAPVIIVGGSVNVVGIFLILLAGNKRFPIGSTRAVVACCTVWFLWVKAVQDVQGLPLSILLVAQR